FILVGPTPAQEVIVARETKPEAPKQASPPPEQTPTETNTPAEVERPKPKSRSRRSTSAEPTLEEMRNAGAHAAERLNNPSPSQTRRSARPDSEAAPTPSPRRKEARPEQPRTSRRPSSQTAKPAADGAVRPTFMESGREQPSATPSTKEQTPAP